MQRRTPLPPDISQRIASLGDALKECPEVVFAYLFGGAARGELRALSDVDVAVYLDEDADPVDALLRATTLATRHLGTDEVDVVRLNTAPTALLGRILLDRVVLLDRDPFLRHRFESKALRTFHDFRIIERRILERRYGGG